MAKFHDNLYPNKKELEEKEMLEAEMLNMDRLEEWEMKCYRQNKEDFKGWRKTNGLD